MKNLVNKAIATILALSTLLSMGSIPTQGASISDGNSKTVKVVMGTRNTFLTTTNGIALGGEDWTYTTNDGISGPAYCVNYGLKAVPENKELTISGQFISNPKTMGAFTTGYPQRSLDDFVNIYLPDHPEIAGLTQDEYAYGTQVAVWATLGQLAIEGTPFTQGSATIAIPQYDAQQIRIYTVIKIILDIADYWSHPFKTSMGIRNFLDSTEKGVYLEHEDGLAGIAAAGNNAGVKLETINGTPYFTREFTAASGTSTWRNGYFIDLWADNAPNGTIFVDTNNQPLNIVEWDGRTLWQLPTVNRYTFLHENGEEYYGTFKLCIPRDMADRNGDIMIHSSSSVAQYNMYLANNTDHTEQSYVIADPAYTPISANTSFVWRTVKSIYGKVSVYKSDGSGQPLEGAVFTLEGGGKSYTGTSDRDGRILWGNLVPGNYTLTETKAPAGYQLAQPVNISVIANETANITVKNDSFRNFRLRKIDTQNGYSLLGATFRFEQIDGGYSTDAVTGHDGYIHFVGDELPFGTYKVYEVQAPEGYQKDTSVQTVTWTGVQDVSLTFKNVRKLTILLIKKDADTNEALENAVFNVYKDGTLVTTVTTNRAGEARVSDVTEGYYEFEEMQAPTGYTLNSTRHGIHVDPYNPATSNDPVLVVSNNKKPGLKIIKYDEQTMKPMSGVVFEVFRDTNSLGTYITDSRGEINLTDLAAGTYLVKEVAASPGYIVNSTPQQIELTAGQTATLVFLNLLKPGIRLVKLDGETLKPLAGARFLIQQVGGSFSREFVTGSAGEIELTSLEPGAYTVKELSAPDGYVADDNARIIQINAGENASFIFTNTKKPGLIVWKYDEQTAKPLPDAEFSISYKGRELIHEGVTSSEGNIRLDNLREGWVTVTEIAPPPGYLLSTPNSRDVYLVPGRVTEIKFDNLKRPTMTIQKVDGATNQPLANATFRIAKIGDGTRYYDRTTNVSGIIEMTDLEPGIYSVQEIIAPSGYILNDTEYHVELFPGQTSEIVVENAIRPQLKIIKYDQQSRTPMPDTTFEVWRDAVLIGTYTTNANGEIHLTGLEPGTYLVKEVSTDDSHVVNSTPQQIEIKAGSHDTVTLVFLNQKKPGIHLVKLDSETMQPLANAVFRITKVGAGSSGGGSFDKEFTTDKNGVRPDRV